MKKLFLFTIGAVLLSFGAKSEEPANGKSVYNVETNESKVHWLGKKVTGEHTGNVSLFNGDVTMEGDNIVAASIKMDMNTITCTDLTNEQWNQKLVGHLKSDDFFSVETHPEAMFNATEFSAIKEDENGNNYNVTGMLTIKGISHEISFPAKVNVSNSKLTALGSATIDRTKYDIKYGSGSFFKGLGDNMIYDDFEITFELVASVGEAN